MSFLDRLAVSIRHIRGRIVESVLVILATAVGVALVAAMAAFIRSYNTQTEYLLSHPAYRELIVEAVGNETVLDEPAVRYDAETTREVDLGFDDVQTVLANTTLIATGYLADREQLSTQMLPGGRRPGFGAGAAGAPGQRPQGAAGTGALRPPAGFQPPETADQGPGGFAPDQAGGRRGGQAFNLEQFFSTDENVITELPIDSFPGRSVTTGFFPAYGLTVAEGSGMTDEDFESGNQVLVLGSSLADTLFPNGDALGARVRLNVITYSVVGILAPTELTDAETGTSYNDVAFTPNGEAQITFGGRTIRVARPTRTVRFAVDDSADLERAESELAAFFDAEYGSDSVRITAPLEELETEREKLGRILSVVLFLAAAALFIASINLFNLMLMRVIKRTKSVGIARALGATRRDVVRQFLNESAFMSMIGAVLGLAASPFVYRLLETALVSNVSSSISLSWPYLLLGGAAALVFSMIFGIYPARQGGRTDAALAIRTE